MGRGGRIASRAAKVALALALVAFPALKADPAGAAALPLVVNDTRDLPDNSVGNGVCATAGGRCTLRAAIQEANALVGHDTINVPPGVYELEVPFVNEDTQSTGDHDIADSVSIVGTGPAATIVDGGFPTASAPVEARGIDRLFEIHPTAGNVTFRALTIREGYSEEAGGGIQNWSPGLLTLENVHILDNLAGKAGGGLNNDDPHNYEWPTGSLPETATIPSGRVEITNSRLAGNSASEGGAAINNVSNGSVAITNSQVVDNPGQMIPDPAQVIDPLEPEPIEYIPGPGVYEPSSSAIVDQGEFEGVGTIRIVDSLLARNFSPTDGPAFHGDADGNLEIVDTRIEDNITEGNGGGIYTNGGKVTITRTVFDQNEAYANAGAYDSNGAVSKVGLRSKIAISSSTFSRNKAWAEAGAIASGGDGDLQLTDVDIDDNEAVEDAGGGFTAGDRSSLVMTRGTVTDNFAYSEGGGAYTASERPIIIRDAVFSGNSAGVPGLEGNDAGGGGIYTEGGPVEITGVTISGNTGTAEGGGLTIDNHGQVDVRDTVVHGNSSLMDGGGVENSGSKVTFERVTVSSNKAVVHGGGIHNSSSGEYTVLDTTIRNNRASDGGGFTNASDSTLVMRRTLITGNHAKKPAVSEDPEEGGYGGGFHSISDGGGLMENTTISHNRATFRGGGMYHDADAAFRIVNTTIWRNAALHGGGLSTVESDFVPSIPPQPNPLKLKNTIVAGSLEGGSCDAYVTSEGGNLAGPGTTCFIVVPGSDLQMGAVRDRQGANPALDALADNGGATLTHAPRYGSLAIDGGVGPCPETDARMIARPQNGRCDVGAYEWAGAPPLPDGEPPDTQYLGGPVQDSLETSAFFFTGTDNLTPTDELIYECRLIEHELTEAPEPQSPFEAQDPMYIFQSCNSGWQTELFEDGLYTFEVRAIDRAGREDPTPAQHIFNGTDTNPPDTMIVEKPPLQTNSRAATFTFSGVDNGTPAPFLEYECRLDSRDPEMWLECFNPSFFSNLTTGEHLLEVRALDGNELYDPSPARYRWTVGVPQNCDQANVTLTPSADGWVDEVNPTEAFMFETELQVRSGADGDPTAQPPEPIVGQNARTLIRFPVPTDDFDCELESATLRMYSEGHTEDRTLQARPLAGPFRESTLTWMTQPATLNSPAATTTSGDAYREWDVKAHVEAMIESGVNHGWQIREAVENDPEGADHSFASRETPQDPPEVTLPELRLRYEADTTTPASTPPTLPPGTQPTAVHCGEVLTESTLVGNDLIDCPGEGLVVGADNIVVDLGGHRIDGPDYLIENTTGQEEGFPAGIRVSGRTNVIVRNGTVQEFGWGVLLSSGTTHSTVDNLDSFRHAVAGVEFFDADDGRNGNTVKNSKIADNELGVLLGAGTERAVVKDNEIHGNLGEQVFIHNSDENRVEGNTMHGIPTDPNLDSDGGVLLEGSSGNTLVGNTVHDTGDAGVNMHMGSHRNVVEGGIYFRNGDAGVIISDSDRNKVLDITSHQQSDGGVVLSRAHNTVVTGSDLRFNPSGVEASDTNHLLLQDNDASDSLQTGFEVGNGVGIRVVDNIAHRAGGAGIGMEGATFDALGTPVGGAVIEGNRTDQTGESGIIVADGGHTIRNNIARNNAGFGIDAGDNPENPGDPFPGTNVDGGGNRATGNGEVEQCRGVVCLAAEPTALIGPDITAPETVIDEAPADGSGETATFVFHANDATPDGAAHSPNTAIQFECRLDPLPDPLPEPQEPDLEPPNPGEPPDIDTPPDGEGWVECTSPFVVHNLDEGPHHFEVRATDFADNEEITPATHDWVVELRPEEEGPGVLDPETRIASGPPSVTTNTTAVFRFAGSDDMTFGPDLTFECKLDPPGPDAGAWAACTTPTTYEDLATGTYTFAVRAFDRQNNADPEPATMTWTINPPPPDIDAPETTIDSGPDRTTVHTSATFTFSSDDPDAEFECKLTTQVAWTECASPYELSGLPPGNRIMLVRAVDRAGNEDLTPAEYDWTISTPPVPTFIHCGMKVTHSIIVRNDIVDCLFDGLVVDAHGITIDLDGHTLDGKGVGAAIRNKGFDNVTIKNGRMVDWDWGVALNVGTRRNVVENLRPEMTQEAAFALGHIAEPDPNLPVEPPDPFPSADSGVRENIIRDNTVIGNKRGVWVTANAQHNLIEDNFFATTSDDAVWLERSHHNRVEHNEMTGSSGAGVMLEGSGNNVVADNEMESNNSGGVLIDVTHTPPVDVQSNDNRVERNLIEESGGLEIIESDRNQLIENVVKRANDSAVNMEFARDNLIKGNDLRTNKSGINLKSSSGNRIELNDFSDSESTGVSLESDSFDNELVRNQSSNNDGEGFYIGVEAPSGTGMLIEGNVANNNKGFGFYIPKPAHIIKGNSANDNGSWGIYAGLPSNGHTNVDAGGNRGQNNLGPLDPITLLPQQCHLVNCEGGPPIGGDVVAPDTLIIERPSNPSNNDTALFRFTGTDNASDVTFQCSLTGTTAPEAFAPCSSPAVFENLSPGAHTFKVRSVDASGNVDSSPATYIWTVGEQPAGQPPETTIDVGPDLTTASNSATFEFVASERNASFQCRLDNAEFGPCAWVGIPGMLTGTRGTITYNGVSVGTHTFQVRAIDADGNIDATPPSWTWRVTEPPLPVPGVCGEFVTTSIRLTSDLIDCPGHGLIVGASDITIDLDGHVIDGTGLDAGVLNNGFDSVTVTGGHIHEFDYGVMLSPGTSLNVVHNVRVENSQEAGVMLSDADQNGLGNTIRDNEILGNNYGVALTSGSRHTVIRDNEFGANQDAAVYLEQASQIRVQHNEIVRSAGPAVFMMGGGNNHVADNTMITNGQGVVVGEELIPSNNNVVERNLIEETNGGGVVVADSLGTQILNNDMRESNGPGIELDLARSTVVRGNDLRSSKDGIGLSESSHNLIEFNEAGGTLGTGISLELSYDNDIVDNQTNGNGGEGIEVSDSAPAGQGNLIARNTADSNGGDGIIVEGGGHTLAENHTMLNAGYGIYAPVGAIDGGGNFAAGNMEPAQCVGVVCVRGTAPGTPETWFDPVPPTVTHSRNMSFTYMGSDNDTPIVDMVFECRLDTTNDQAWEDCEYPHEVRNLSPGTHTLEIRAVDIGELADDTPAKHTWEYRPLPANDPPEVFLDIVPERETWTLDSIFTFHSNEPDVTFQCKVDLEPWEDCGFGTDSVAHQDQGGFEWGLEEEQVGPHTFFVRATDHEGNVGVPQTYTWHLLGVVTIFTDGPGFTPGTEGEPATGGEVQSSEATIDFESNVADATFECSLDLEPFEPCTPPVHYTGLLQGDHELRVVATDSETGASEVEAAIYEWEVLEPFDDVPPETVLDRAPADNSSSTIFEFSGTDDQTPPSLLTFQCRIDSTNELDWEECTNPYNLLEHYTYADFELAPGPHRFEVRAVDMFEPLIPDPSNPDFEGNVDPSPIVYEWTMTEDTSPPGTGITSGPSGRTGETEALFEFFGTDNATPGHLVEFECSINNEPFEPCSSPETVQLEHGTHRFRMRAVDIAGNVDPTPAERMWEIVAAPVAEISSGPSGRILPGQQGPPVPSTAEQAVFTFTSDEPNGTFECSVDGAEFEPCTSPYVAFAVTDGEHSFEVRGVSDLRTVDGEPIVQEPPTSYEWLSVLGPDNTRPDTSIVSGPPASTLDPIATFEFAGTDNRTSPALMEFECSLDGQPYNGCESPEQFTDMTHGPHELLVRARDVAGNLDATPARHTWTVALPPVVTITGGPDEVTDSTSATFSWTSNVPGSVFKCWLDGAMVSENCTSPVTYNNLAGGEHLFAVLATAPGGHVALQWEEWEWTVGHAEAPVTTFHSGPLVTTHDTSAEFVFSANKPNSTFMCSLDGREPEPCTSPLSFPRLHAGEHRLEVTAFPPPLFDRFGELIEPDFDEIPAVYEWEIIDTEAPNASIDWGPRTATASLIAVFGLSSDDPTAILECSLDGGGYNECEPVTEFTDLDRGPHTLQVRARDLLGNVDQTPARHDWTITQPGPPNTPVGTNVTVTLPMPDGPGNATVNFFDVNSSGNTTVDALTGGPELPAGYTMGGARFYDIGTTAGFGEPVRLCLDYDPSRYQTSAVRLLQADGLIWIDVTMTNNPFTGNICASEEADIQSGEGGLFVIAAANTGIAPHVSILSGPPLVSNSGTATFELWADMPDAQIQCSIDGLPFEPCGPTVTYTHLEEGDQELQVQALSAFGLPPLLPTIYAWEVVLPPDNTPPDTTILRGPPPITASFINWVEMEGHDDQTHPLEMEFECRVDNGPWESCESPEEIEVLTRGQHRLEVRAMDETGNVDPTPAFRNFTLIDLSVPDTSIDSGPNSETTSTSATFTFSGEEEQTGEEVFEFECALDDGEFVDCSEQPYTITGVSGGPHVVYVRARDPDGNLDPTPDMYEWLVMAPVDTTPPDTEIFFGPAEGSQSGAAVLFSFLSSESPAEFECSLDDRPYEGCEGVHELEGLATGSHTLRVRALDIAEPPNVDPSPAVRNWVVLGEPHTRIDSGPPSETTSASAVFTFSSDQTAADGVTFQCSVDGSEWTPCSSPFTAGPLAAGDPESGEEHEFEVRAVSRFTTLDGEPIVDETPESYEWTVFPQPDPPAFDTVFTSTPPTATAGGPDAVFFFSFEARDGAGRPTNLATFECSLDDEPYEECEPPLEYDDLPYGEHTLRVRAVDPAFQPDATPAEFTWTIEDAPETSLLPMGLPEFETGEETATFTFSSPSPFASFECALDTPVYTPCASPKTYADVPHGEHEFLVRAKSPAGSVDETPEVHRWTSGDMTAPVVTIVSAPTATSGPEVTTEETTATFEWISDDPAAQYMCTLDGAPDPVPASHLQRFCSSGVEYEDLAPGLTYTFSVEPTKPFLLAEPEPAEWEWSIVDTTPPDTTIVSAPPGQVLPDAPALFTFSSNEPNATFECALDGADFNSCESPHDLTGIEAGRHTLLVRAVDLADPPNVDPTPASYTWTVIGPPTTTLLSMPELLTAERTATFTFEANQPNVTFACSIDDLDFVPCSSGVSYANLAAGDHEFTVQATNAFDMVEEPAVTHTWTIVDAAAPETTVELRPQATTQVRSATFGFSSDEADATFECALDTPAGEEPSWNGCGEPPANAFTFEGLAVGDHSLLVRAVDPSDNFDATPAAYEWTIEPAGGSNTAPGAGVTVVNGDATVTFAQVSAGGHTAADALLGTAPLPPGYTAAGFHEISTTAQHLGVAAVCLAYDPLAVAGAVRLLHFEGSEWLDVTTTDASGVVCGEPGELGAFAIATATTAVVPETSIISSPEDPTVATGVEFAFEAVSLTAATFECSLDEPTPEWGSCDATQRFDGLLPGEHELLVRAVNELGMFDATPARYEWTQQSLDTFVDEGPDEATEERTASFSFSSDYAGATFECLLDDSTTWEPCAAETTYPDLPIGDHELQVRAVTPDGEHFDETPAEWSWEVGEVPQPVTIESGPPANTESRSATFVFSSLPGETFECSLDGAPFTICSSPRTYNGLTLGTHTFRVQTHSPDPIVEPVPAEHVWTVEDNTAPDTTITFGPPAVTGNPNANLTFTGSEVGTTFECALNGGDWAPCDSAVQYSGLALGDYTFRVRAIDAAGNPDPSPATYSWRLVARPETTIDTGPESDITTRTTGFTFSSDQAGSTFECSLDLGAYVACSSPHTINDLTDGDHTLEVRAINALGVADDTPAAWDFSVDASAPETTIATGPPTSGPTRQATFTFASNEAAVTFECSLDNAAFAECETPFLPEALTDGQHTLRVRAIDDADNVDQSPATHTWTFDGTAPQTTITADPGAASASTTASFGFSSSEAGSTFECSLDNAAFSSCSSPRQYTGLSAGAHTFRVRATDPAGNADASPALHEWSVDTTPPGTILTQRPPASTTSTSAAFEFASGEQNVTFQCSLDNAAFSACTSPQQYTGLATGQHNFRVRAVDAAGNIEPSPESHTWTVQSPDSTAPQTSLNVIPESPSTESDASFEFISNEAGSTFECSLDNAAFVACTSPRDYTGLADGQHNFRVRATDPSGNVDLTPASYTWTIDTVAPQTTIGAGAPPATGTGTGATFNFTSSEAGSTFECALDSASYAACTSPRALTGLAVGQHTFRVRAIDAAENVDETPATHTWTITAPPVGCNGSTVTLGANIDSWVLQSSAGQNYGTDSVLKLETKTGADARAFVRFNLPAIPAGCQVTNARLRLYASSYKTGRTLQAWRVAAPWTEGALTWSNQPQTAGTAVTTASGSGYREWVVTQQVKDMYAPNANHGFTIRDAGANGQQPQDFHSREKGSDNPPRLVLTFAP